MVAPNPNRNDPHSLKLPAKTTYEIVGDLAVFHFNKTSVAFEPSRVVGIAAPQLASRVILLDGGQAIGVETNDSICDLAELVDRAARDIDGDPAPEGGQHAGD